LPSTPQTPAKTRKGMPFQPKQLDEAQPEPCSIAKAKGTCPLQNMSAYLPFQLRKIRLISSKEDLQASINYLSLFSTTNIRGYFDKANI
jgi:hypothetical protein